MRIRISWLFLATCLVSGCGSKSETPPLRIAAASDLQTVLPKLAKQFEERHNVKVVLTFGSSGQLSEQIRAGAPFDLFMSANKRFVADLIDVDRVKKESLAPYARGELVLLVGKRNLKKVASLADLTGAEIRSIAIANPEIAPYGIAAKQTLEKAGLWAKVEPKVVQAENVRQVLQFVTSGNADVGFVGSALTQDLTDLEVVSIDPTLYEPIIQFLGTVTSTKQGDEAEAFRQFVLDDEGQKLLGTHGFKPPGL